MSQLMAWQLFLLENVLGTRKIYGIARAKRYRLWVRKHVGFWRVGGNYESSSEVVCCILV